MNIKGDFRLALSSRMILFLTFFLTAYPIIFVMITAVKSTKEFYTNVWSLPHHYAWSNFYDAWVTAHIGQYFLTSLIVVFVSVLLIVILGALAGYALARLNIPYAEVITFLFISTLMLPSESVIMPLYLMMSKLGWIGGYETLIIPYIGWGLPITIYILKNFFSTIPKELLESARMDGSGETRTFVQIIVPLMLPAIATVSIFNLVSFWGELIWANTTLSVSSSIRTLPMGVLAFQSQFATDWGPLSASMCIVLIPLIVFFMFVQKYFIQGITGGSVKG